MMMMMMMKANHPYNLQQQQQNTVQACHNCWSGYQQDLWLPMNHE
jgi:hypothetical protein